MKNNKFIIITVILVMVIFIFIREIIPMINESKIKNRVFNDIQTKSDEVIRGIVGIIPEDNNNHNGIGSGVIFDKKDNTYYVVTAKHVIDKENSKFKIFTKDTEYSGQIINADDNVNFEIPDEEYYKSLLDTKIEYISDTTDLAILSFEYNGDLSVLEFENNKLSINDRIMVIGHPEGNRYQISFGYIKSNLKDVKGDKVIEHDTYMKKGNSGGVALTENNKIAGINIAGSFTLLGKYRIGYMIPYDIVEENINKFKNKDNVANKTYTYTKEGFGGDFTITLNEDGTETFYEGYLSSYIGNGTWNIENDILYLNDKSFKNKFRIHDNELEFIEEGSMNFPYVKLKDGDKFIGKTIQ